MPAYVTRKTTVTMMVPILGKVELGKGGIEITVTSSDPETARRQLRANLGAMQANTQDALDKLSEGS